MVVQVLRQAQTDANWYEDIAETLQLDKLHVELALETLDKAGFLEHGTSVRGSWTSRKGDEFLEKYGSLVGEE